MQIIKDEIDEMVERFGDERRTEIVYAAEEFDIEDLIAEEDMVVTVSNEGYIKRMSPRAYKVQNRGGRGVRGMKTKEEDFVEHLFVASTHSYIMFLTSKGQCYWLKVNLLRIDPNDQICAVVPVREFSEEQYLFTATRRGIVKKTVLSAYQNVRRDGIIALKIHEGDDLIGAAILERDHDVVLITRQGRSMRFNEEEVRSMGRVSGGVKGIGLRVDDEVVDMVVVRGWDVLLLTICEKGYGKRTSQAEYPRKHRGGMGVIDIKATDRNGPVVACKEVLDEDEVMIITQNGVMIRTAVSGITTVGRNTQGVRVINLDEGDRVIDMTRLPKGDDETSGEEPGQTSP
jgi:DNA gyrase subunit A